MARTLRLSMLLSAALVAIAVLSACASSQAGSSYPGFSTPKSALETFFSSAQRQDYATTYSCYDKPYQDRVTESEFISHRRQAAALNSYSIGPISASGGTAEATVTLQFAPGSGASTVARGVEVREELVDQAGAWKIKVQ